MDQPFSHPRAFTAQRLCRVLPMALLLACGSCGLNRAPTTGLTPPMPVQAPLRKQVLQGYMPFGSIGWVSNDKVIFSGKPVNSNRKDALYVWDQKSKPRLLLSNSPGGCASRHTIRAAQLRDSGKVQMFSLRAPDFNAKPLTRTPQSGPSVFDPVSCSWIASPEALREHKWQALRQGDGFLDFTPNGRQIGPLWVVEHLDADERTRRDTGIRMPRPVLPMATYAAHDDSYLVYDLHLNLAEAERWIRTSSRTLWHLDRQRRGQRLSLPAGPWVGLGGGTIAFLPSRPGVLITSNNFARDGAAGGAGVYLLRPGTAAQRLEQGLAHDAAVSPDGCRLAYSFKPRLDIGIPEGGPRLVVIDLCDSKIRQNAQPHS